MPTSSAIWFAVIAGTMTVVVIVWIVRTKTNARRLDVGVVSDQWVAEHRVGSGDHVTR